VPCVGAIIVDDHGRMLLIKRANEPARGCWSVPGGRVEAGETDEAATAREVLEETGLAVRVGPLVGTVERDAPDGATYLIHDYRCIPVLADAIEDVVAGDDAVDVGWFTPAQVRRLPCSPGLVDSLEAWGVLPR
jgi:ADP-ribose pyrophosphatase YjhB (NUDIX family)